MALGLRTAGIDGCGFSLRRRRDFLEHVHGEQQKLLGVQPVGLRPVAGLEQLLEPVFQSLIAVLKLMKRVVLLKDELMAQRQIVRQLNRRRLGGNTGAGHRRIAGDTRVRGHP